MDGRIIKGIVLALAGWAMAVWTAPGVRAADPVRIRPSLQAEYFNRTITWDEEAYTSKLEALLFSFSLEVEPLKGFSANVTLGYSPSNFNGLVFRQMPFSVDLEGGYLGGMLLGGGLKNKFVVSQDWEMDLEAQFVMSLGSKASWLITELAQSGTLSGNGTWYRIQAGPVFWYKGFMYFSPYLRISFDKLWGTFHMEEVIGPLNGLEDKAVKGSGLFSVALGTFYEPSPAIGLRGEIYVLPRSKGVDYGALGRLAFSF